MRCRNHTLFFIIFLFLIVLLRTISRLSFREHCSLEQSKANIKLLCEGYMEGLLTGSFCPYICQSDEMVLQKCLNHARGKEIYLMTWRGEHFIMKSKKPSWHDYRRFLQHGDDAIKANISLLYHYAGQALKEAFNIEGDPYVDLISDLWLPPHSQIPLTAKQRLAFIESIWSLLQQEEYLSVMYLRRSKFMPLLYGTCGHFYLMEYLPASNMLTPKSRIATLFQSKSFLWKDKVVIAMYLLELLKSLNSEFNEVIHVCDMKGENFGLTKDGAVKVVDVDMLLSDSKLKSIFQGSECSSDEECNFFDCKARCNLETHSCTTSRMNSNIQVLCEQIFVSHLQNGFRGLLDNPPVEIREDLEKILHQCISSHNEDTYFLQHLYKFLNSHLYAHMLSHHSEQ